MTTTNKIPIIILHCGHEVESKDTKFDCDHEKVWCPECNTARMNHIDKRFDKILKEFPPSKVF